jgi:hypothetical protein
VDATHLAQHWVPQRNFVNTVVSTVLTFPCGISDEIFAPAYNKTESVIQVVLGTVVINFLADNSMEQSPS